MKIKIDLTLLSFLVFSTTPKPFVCSLARSLLGSRSPLVSQWSKIITLFIAVSCIRLPLTTDGIFRLKLGKSDHREDMSKRGDISLNMGVYIVRVEK